MSDKSFVLGFIAGEGSFTVSRVTSDGRLYMQPYFQLRVKENDKDVIDSCRDVFGSIGTVRHADEDMYNWRVEKKEQCAELVEKINECAPEIWFDSEKGKNFEVWADIVRIHAGGQTGAEERLEMARIARDGLNNNARNAKGDDDWHEMISEFEDQINKDTYYCNEPNTHRDGTCNQRVSGPDEVCETHK